MKRNPRYSLDREIEALLAVEPSPDLVFHVRTHILDTPVSGWTMGLNMGWTSLAAGSVVVAVFWLSWFQNLTRLFSQRNVARCKNLHADGFVIQ